MCRFNTIVSGADCTTILSSAITIIIVVLLAFPISTMATTTSSNTTTGMISRLGPIGRKRWKATAEGEGGGNGYYTWQASVDRATGKAFAREVSHMPSSSLIISPETNHNNDKNDSSHPVKLLQFRGSKKTSILMEQTQPMLGHYPTWLCRPSVTFGLLKAVPTLPKKEEDGNHNDDAADGTEIRTRFLGLHILTLGKPTFRRFSIPKDRSSSSSTTLASVQWSYPILGGLLAAKPGGFLVATLHEASVRPSSQQQQRLGATTLSPPFPSTMSQTPVLETELIDYRPALVGAKKLPVNRIRTRFYLSTQSVIHGYAMWRFHRHVQSFFSGRTTQNHKRIEVHVPHTNNT